MARRPRHGAARRGAARGGVTYPPGAMASKRKPRNPSSAPRAVPSDRRQSRAAKHAQAENARRRGARALGTEGERPRGLFGGVPVSEAAILGGLIAGLVGFVDHGTVAIIVGLIICGLGVMEVGGREHFSGFRSHSALLAGVPAVGVEAAIVYAFGDPHNRAWLILVVVPVFALFFWTLRHRFQIARQARVARAARGRAPSGVSSR